MLKNSVGKKNCLKCKELKKVIFKLLVKVRNRGKR